MAMTRSLFLCSLLFVSSIAVADVQQGTLGDQKQLAVTIYNQDLALVRDRRAVNMNSGSVSLTFRDIGAGLRPETALLRSMTSPGSLRVIEQNFDQDLLTPQRLLEKHVGKTVSVVRINPATGAETRERAEVLSARDGVVVRIDDRIETGASGRIVFDEIPAGLNDRPSLVFLIDNRGPQRQELELSYLTGGLSWKADYVAELSADGLRLDISGWFTIANSGGTVVRDATLRLVAGDVNRVRQGMTMAAMARSGSPAAAPESVAQESFSDYRLYKIDRPVTILENQTKQIALLSASGVPVRREWVLRGNEFYYGNAQDGAFQKLKVGMFMELKNGKDERLGTPLPKGTMRIYMRDSGGNLQFVGEDGINNTPVGEKVRLRLGDAFDVTARRRQTGFARIGGDDGRGYAFESSHEVVLKNAKREPVTVVVQEPMPGEWTVMQESHPHAKEAANLAVWRIRIPAEGQAVLSYRVRTRR